MQLHTESPVLISADKYRRLSPANTRFRLASNVYFFLLFGPLRSFSMRVHIFQCMDLKAKWYL